MIGALYLKDGQPPNRGNVCVSGYDRNKPNFCLSNFYAGDSGAGFTFEDNHLGEIKFPTAEHFLHFQKLSRASKEAKLALWQNERTPGEILKGIRNKQSKFYIDISEYSSNIKTNGKFSPNKWDELSPKVQMQINATKYQQSTKFRASIDHAINIGEAFGDGLGAATIIEDTATCPAPREENIWGTGRDGLGTNVLGNTQTALANLIANMKNAAKDPIKAKLDEFKDKTGLYEAATAQFKAGVQKSLVAVRGGKSRTDTADLGPTKVNTITLQDISAVPFAPTPKAETRSLYSHGRNRRLLVKNDKVTNYQYRENRNQDWQEGTDLSRFDDLIEYFGLTHNYPPQVVPVPKSVAASGSYSKIAKQLVTNMLSVALTNLMNSQITSNTFLSDWFLSGRVEKEQAIKALLNNIHDNFISGSDELENNINRLFRKACESRSNRGTFSAYTASAQNLISKICKDDELSNIFKLNSSSISDRKDEVLRKMQSSFESVNGKGFISAK